jgi:molybdenum cofactor synthesis domain-containing protein
LGLLLGLGITKVRVFRRPKVTIVATGSELTNVTQPATGKMVDSHSHVFKSLVRAIGGDPVSIGPLRDESSTLSRQLKGSLARSDFVLTLGGTSVGKLDILGKVVSELHPEVFVHGIRMDRGRVSGVAAVNGKPLLMMPGPIQGAMNAFILFGVPIINFLAGNRERGFEMTCVLGSDWRARSRFLHFTKVVYVKLGQGVEIVAKPIEGDTESATVLTKADAYMVIPERVTRLKRGSRVKVRLLPGFSQA